MTSNGNSAAPGRGQNSTPEGLRMIVAIDFGMYALTTAHVPSTVFLSLFFVVGTTYSSIAYANTFEVSRIIDFPSQMVCPSD